ncbi:MAG: coproporphyrinogen III oxidase family protein [Clostridium sp.]|nr:coproporphyrinogen III oxidase family protein [Bacteroides sp.]MCM1198678.1 coproporphyrinogen III oxidase family protein [Clostridium sp.]
MIYIHVPYCRSFCTYCGFYSEIPVNGCSRYVDAACAEISYRKNEIAASAGCCNFVSSTFSPGVLGSLGACRMEPTGQDGLKNTLYVGGGTPSVLSPGELARMVDAVKAILSDADGIAPPFEEFTVEVNPDDIVSRGPEYVEGLRVLGVDRISMGVQSLDDNVLRWMNRRHNADAAREAYRIIRSAGIDNISIDLIFGYMLPGICSEEHWLRTVEQALDIAGDGTLPNHVSAYQLSVDGGSVLADMVAAGKYQEAPEELCARQYGILCGLLSEAGYRHYEISNFAQPGYEARHNSAYWQHVPYVGIGPAAHSFIPAGGTGLSRTWNVDNVGRYVKSAMDGHWDDIISGESLDGALLREEKIMLALRTDKGILRKYIDEDPVASRAVEKFLRSGALVPVDSETLEYYGYPSDECRLRIPEERFFVSDDIISELL